MPAASSSSYLRVVEEASASASASASATAARHWAAARARGITVTNTPGVLTEDTADVALALMLAVPRRIAEGDKVARAGDWNGWSPTGMLGHRINGKRLGIIGMGRIGSAVARRARGPASPRPSSILRS